MGVREYNIQKKPLLGQANNALTMLVIINALVFVSLYFIWVIYLMAYDDKATASQFFHKQILDWLMLPASLDKLATRPWTVFTYMFCNYQPMLLISNLLWLWAFGYILVELTGNQKVFPIYIYGGVAGAIFFLVSANFIGVFHQNIGNISSFEGAGAGVMAVAIAATMLAPGYRIFPMINGGVPLWVLTLVFVAIEYATVASINGSNAIACLAGAGIGFVFITQLRKGYDLGKWMNDLVTWVNDLFNPEKKHSQDPKEQLFYKAGKHPYKKTANITQQRLDDILDKINQQGYHLLTDEEKEFLKRASKEEL